MRYVAWEGDGTNGATINTDRGCAEYKRDSDNRACVRVKCACVRVRDRINTKYNGDHIDEHNDETTSTI